MLHEKTRDEIREERSEFNLIVRRCNEIGKALSSLSIEHQSEK